MLKEGFSIDELKEEGVSIDELKEWGVSIDELKKGGSLSRQAEGEVSIDELKEGGGGEEGRTEEVVFLNELKGRVTMEEYEGSLHR